MMARSIRPESPDLMVEGCDELVDPPSSDSSSDSLESVERTSSESTEEYFELGFAKIKSSSKQFFP